MDISNLTQQQKVETLKALYHDVAGMGREGDTMLAHINPEEAAILKALGGSGTINPNTGLPEYKKAVKKVVKVAAPIAAIAAVGMATGGFGLPSIGTALGSLKASEIISIGGAALGLAGNIQQAKYAKKSAQAVSEQTSSYNKAEEARNRYNALLQERQRLSVIRQARIEQGSILAQTGGSGLGSAGTSSFTGSVGSIGSQTSANLGAINVAQSTGEAISGFNQAAAAAGTRAANYSGQAQGWSQVASLGGSIFDSSDKIGNIVGKLTG